MKAGILSFPFWSPEPWFAVRQLFIMPFWFRSYLWNQACYLCASPIAKAPNVLLWTVQFVWWQHQKHFPGWEAKEKSAFGVCSYSMRLWICVTGITTWCFTCCQLVLSYWPISNGRLGTGLQEKWAGRDSWIVWAIETGNNSYLDAIKSHPCLKLCPSNPWG